MQNEKTNYVMRIKKGLEECHQPEISVRTILILGDQYWVAIPDSEILESI